ncbi:MAG: hypothetical protein Q7U92_03340 [Bradyrhizobium sp.]|nr:hypothetical protein [Bradyrhizobium sp.]
MQAAAGGGTSNPSGHRNGGHHSIVSELVSLIGHVQASMKLLEVAISGEAAPGDLDAPGNVFVLDDVTPRYAKANAALNNCNASLGVALHYLMDARTARHDAGDSGRLINRA